MPRSRKSENLAWIDLEMTGLDPRKDVILQAALIVTNSRLEPLAEYCADVWQPPENLAHMTPFVRDMHEKSGLLSRVARSKADLGSVERDLLKVIAEHCDFPAVLCGNSIGQDRRFVDAYMPGLAGYLHYRVLDVSSLKILAELWYGSEAKYKKPKEGAHDALFDIRQSIAELRHYRTKLMRPVH
jgi:oligoribonuclease